MKTVHLFLENELYERLQKIKKDRSWMDFMDDISRGKT